MRNYLDLLRYIIDNGQDTDNRTKIKTRSFPFLNLKWNMDIGLPCITTKKIHFKSIIHELLWMLSGDTNIKYLNDNGVSIWDEWATPNGNLGPIYGEQWRSWGYYDENDYQVIDNVDVPRQKSIDQIQNLVDSIKKDPTSRRLLVSAWNVSDLSQMRLPPCHYAFQVVISGNRLNLQWNQRSVDSFLGLPYNITFYAILMSMLAQVTGYIPGTLSVATGDTHVYHNHFDQVKLQLTREPLPLPALKLNPDIKNIFDFKFEDVIIENYQSHPAIKGVVAV